jgi:hypothetical protein
MVFERTKTIEKCIADVTHSGHKTRQNILLMLFYGGGTAIRPHEV